MSEQYVFHAGEATVLAADGQCTDAMPEILIGRTDGAQPQASASSGQKVIGDISARSSERSSALRRALAIDEALSPSARP